jgi:hypothetical protein
MKNLYDIQYIPILHNTVNINIGEKPLDMTKIRKLIIITILKYNTEPLWAKYPVLPSSVNIVSYNKKNTVNKAIKPYIKPLPIVIK